MCEAQIHTVFTEHTLKTGITSVITKQCIVFIFKFSCRSSDFLGSSAMEYFEGEGLRDGGEPGGPLACTPRVSGRAHEFTVSKERVWFLSRGLAEPGGLPSSPVRWVSVPCKGGHLPKAHG